MRHQPFHTPSLRISVGFIFLLLPAVTCFGDMLIQQNLQEMAECAEIIFSGTCVSAKEGTMYFPETGQIGFTEYLFSIDEWIKGEGNSGRMIAIRQVRPLIGASSKDTNPFRIESAHNSFLLAPKYQPERQYVLFLHAANEWGLTCPVGSVQGVFTVHQEAGSEPSVTNGIGNLGLFRGMEHVAPMDKHLSPRGSITTSIDRKARINISSFLTMTKGLMEQGDAY